MQPKSHAATEDREPKRFQKPEHRAAAEIREDREISEARAPVNC